MLCTQIARDKHLLLDLVLGFGRIVCHLLVWATDFTKSHLRQCCWINEAVSKQLGHFGGKAVREDHCFFLDFFCADCVNAGQHHTNKTHRAPIVGPFVPNAKNTKPRTSFSTTQWV